MKTITLALAAAALIGGASTVITDNAMMHDHDFHHEGAAIHVQDFDVTLAGRLLTATEGVYTSGHGDR